MRRRLLLTALALTLVVASCGSDDLAGSTSTTVANAPTTTSATTTSDASDTSTSVAESTDVPAEPIDPGADPDADAIADVYAVVFDSSVGYEDKAPLIADPSGLEATVEAYGAAGEAVGGITLAATAVGVDGDDASVVYDLYFGENPFQTEQLGSAVRNDGTWKVSRAFFCSIMELARVACP